MKIIFILLFPILLFSQIFKITEEGQHSSKEEACKRALINAKIMAIEEYGVTISSTYSSKTEVNNEHLSSSQKQRIIQTSKHKVKVISYKESISRMNGKYICKVYTLLSIGEKNFIKKVQPKKLKKYNHQYIKTCSVVTDIKFSKGKGKPIFLNFGRNYPNHYFTAVIWKNNRQNFSYDIMKKLLNKKICIKGEVYLYRGQPFINLKDESQIIF